MKNLDRADLDLQTLVDALRLSAESAGPERAAIELLVEHRTWLDRDEFVSYEIWQDPETNEIGARIDWKDVAEDLDLIDAWSFPSASDLAVLRVATALAGSRPVDLRAELTRLDRSAGAAVVDAMVCATRVGDTVLVTRSPNNARQSADLD